MSKKPYKPDMSAELARIERRRIEAGITVDELADAADMQLRQLMRIRTGKRAWRRDVNVLKFALRSIEKRKRS